MNRDSFNHLALIPAAALAVMTTACVELEMDSLDAVDSTDHALLGENGLNQNGLPHNGLPFNGLPFNGLPFNGLPFNGLPFNGLPSASLDNNWDSWLNDLTDDGGMPRKMRNRTLMKYIVKCALAAEASSSFEDTQSNMYVWNGRVGLAPQWETGGITPAQERWISSCIASLVNSAGMSVVVSQRGRANSAIDNMEAGEETSHTAVEGAYFGNVFANPPALYSCRGPGYAAAVNTGRTCTIADGNCAPMQQVGNCEDICSVETRTVNSATFDVYYDCDPDGAGGLDSFSEVTTIYLNPGN